MGALTRQAEIAGTLIAVWPHGDRRTFSSTISGKGLFQSFHRGVWFLFIRVFFLPRFLIRTRWLSRRAHASVFRSARFLLLASAAHSSSKSNSSVCRLNSWLHSSGARVFWRNPFKLFGQICLRRVHLTVKCNEEAVGCTLCWGLHAVDVVLMETFCCTFISLRLWLSLFFMCRSSLKANRILFVIS